MQTFPNTLTPNLDTRSGRMIAAGNLTATVTSKKSGEHMTLRLRCSADNRDRVYAPDSLKNWVDCPLEDATHVFVSVPNQEGWGDKVGTWYPRTGKWFVDTNADPRRVWATACLFDMLNGHGVHPGATILEESRCGVCSRPLTDPVSIERGIGPECYGRATGSKHQVKAVTLHTTNGTPVRVDDEAGTIELLTTSEQTIAQQRDEHEQLRLESKQPAVSTKEIVFDSLDTLETEDLMALVDQARAIMRQRSAGALAR